MKIVVLDGFTTNPGDISWKPLEALGDITVYDNTLPEQVISRSKDAEVLIVNRVSLTREVLSQLPKLKYIGVLATGYNPIDITAARERDIPVCNVPDYCAPTVAQQAIALLLCLAGNVHHYSALVKQGKWEEAIEMSHTTHPLCELWGKALGVVGYGSIGQRVARLGLDLGMNVLLYSRTEKPAPEGCRWVDLPTLFAESDAVSLHCPLNDSTYHLVGEDLLSRMKPTAFLINTSRGGVIDGEALARALNEGRLAGAGVDVLEKEPPEKDDPLVTAKNCYITPHIAWASKEARERLVKDVAENLQAFQQGRPQNVVN